MSNLSDYQQSFLELAQQYEALSFGEFELKSGRTSPYFFNAGKFDTGRALNALGRCYAQAIVDHGLEFDFLFGPAYKGIPLVAVTASALAEHHQMDVPYCFNRKETKDHGEGGSFVGSLPNGRALVLDDVITAGTAIRQAIRMLKEAGASVSGVLIGLDRKERAPNSDISAVMQLQREEDLPVQAIVTLDDISEYTMRTNSQWAKKVQEYRAQYGV